jgi:hypothetical protein
MKIKAFRHREASVRVFLLLCLIVTAAPRIWATENGVSGYPVGIETLMTGMQPGPHSTVGYVFSTYYFANELDNSEGKKALPEFRIRVSSTAFKVAHNWGWRFAGGTLASQIAAPLVDERIHTPGGIASKFGVANLYIVPVNLSYHTEHFHWCYELGYSPLAISYHKSAALNIGQHNQSLAGGYGVTYLSNRGINELSSRVTYVVNGPNHSTGYHSGNELIWEYNADRQLGPRGLALGINGAYYQQITGDRLNGASYLGGYKGRDLSIGPQARIPIGRGGGGLAIKYFRDTLVQNKTRGSALWLEAMVPIKFRQSATR